MVACKSNYVYIPASLATHNTVDFISVCAISSKVPVTFKDSLPGITLYPPFPNCTRYRYPLDNRLSAFTIPREVTTCVLFAGRVVNGEDTDCTYHHKIFKYRTNPP